jgi:hypothetical protein
MGVGSRSLRDLSLVANELAPAGDLPLLPPLSSECGQNPPVVVSAEQHRQYETDGYAFFPSLIDPEAVAELRHVVDEMVARQVGNFSFEPSDPSLVQRITAPHRHSRAFAKLTRNEALCGVVAQIIGPSFRHNNVKLNFKPAHIGSAVEWHQVCSNAAAIRSTCSFFLHAVVHVNNVRTGHSTPTPTVPCWRRGFSWMMSTKRTGALVARACD